MQVVDQGPSEPASADEHARAFVRWLALACIACLVVMAATTFVTGVSQEEFEVVRSVDDYGARIAASEPVLRILMATDALFLSLYAGFFVVLVGVHREGAITWAARAAMVTLLAVAVLDAVEDHHILALARAATLGHGPTMEQIVWQQVESQTKFNLSYVGLVLLGLGLPRRDRLERVFAAAIAWPVPLLGALMWAAGPAFEGLLSFVRWAFFACGFAGAFVVASPSRARIRLKCSGVIPR